MTSPYPNFRPRQARGFSLIELLIAVTLGLILTAAVGYVFVSSSRSFRTQTGVSQVQEEGRFANLLVVPVIRHAGYLPDPLDSNQTNPATYYQAGLNKRAIFGTNNTGVGIKVSSFDPASVLPTTDVLAVTFVGKNPTAPLDSPLRTCLGTDVDSATMAVNVFYIRNDNNGVPNLYCTQNVSPIGADASTAGTSATQPLVAGVRDMQILYGIDTDADFDADRYVTADKVADWTTVASIQITFAIDSVDATEKGVADRGTSAGGGIIAGHLTHTFNTTIDIRNRLHI